MARRDELKRWLGGAAALLAAPGARAQPPACRVESPATTTVLVELYTSQGCSSCPPADRWLSRLGSSQRTRVAPLSLHVKYWDYIGWADPYAQAAFADRQRWLVQAGGGRTLYTPGVFVDGREWRNWSDPVALERRFAEVQRRPAGARITIERDDAGPPRLRVQAQATGGGSARRPALHVALTQSGLQAAVSAGENRGELLRHDHVVRRMDPPVVLDAAGRAAVDWPLDAAALAGGRWQVTAFVQDLSGAGVLQAASMVLSDAC